MQKNTNQTKPTEKTIATRKRGAVPDVYGYKPNHQNTKKERLVHRGRKKRRKDFNWFHQHYTFHNRHALVVAIHYFLVT